MLITIDDDFKPKVQEFIDGVTDYIQRYTNRQFIADVTPSVRVYDANDSYGGTNNYEIVIDDAVEVTKVEIDAQEMLNNETITEYYLYPNNKTPKTRIGLPFRLLRYGRQNVKVTARWGYGDTVPNDIALAATVMVAGIINASRKSEGAVISESIGKYTVTYQHYSRQSHDFDDAQNILNLYRRYA